MASIRRINGKTGPSFKITVSTGRDLQGKQIRHYMTWRPDRPMSDRKLEKAALLAAFEFEKQIKIGYQVDSRQTFDSYTAYVLDLKLQSGLSVSTADNYRNLLRRVSPHIGHMKMTEIRPQHLNLLYKTLASEPMGPILMKPTSYMAELASALPKAQLIRSAHLNSQTVNKLLSGTPVLLSTAQRVAAYWNLEVNVLFSSLPCKRTCPPEYIRSIHSCLSGIFSQAEKELLIQYNPASKASPPRPYARRSTYLEPDQVACVLSALDQEPLKWRALFHVLIVTGCRRSEVLSLKWANLDISKKRLLVNSGVTRCKTLGVADGPTKTRTSRFITLPDETIHLLELYKKQQLEFLSSYPGQWEDLGLIFPSKTGSYISPSSVNAWLSRFCRRHTLPHIHPHAFRHTAASILIASGVDVVTVSKMLGHKRPSMTTDVYSHLIAQAQQEATESIAQTLLRRNNL